MKRQLLLTLIGTVAASAMAWETPTIVMGTETMTIDTIFHAKVGPGTYQTQLHLTGSAPLDVFYLKTDLTTPGVRMRSICPGGHTYGNARTSVMAQNASDENTLYFAGTNGDFYWTSGRATDGTSVVGTPTYAAIVDGEVYKSSASGYQFSVDAQGVARVCRLSFNGTVTKDGTSVPLRGINTDPSNNAVTLYTSRGWTSPCQGQYAGSCAEVPARLVEGDSFVSGGAYSVVVTGTPTSTGDLPVPAGECVLMARGNAVSFINSLQPGDVVNIDAAIFTPEGERIYPTQAVSGNPKNVGGGENLHSEAERADATDRHPRTAIGYSADGNTIIMMVVDGRGPSKGVTTGMLGDLMLYAGAHEAVNLDGGGSSTLYTDALGVRNRCSDGTERAVGNAIFATVDGNVTDQVVAEVKFMDWRMSLPQMALYTPRVFAFNAAGVCIDTDYKDYTLSCPPELGTIINDGKTLLANGNGMGALTVSKDGASSASIAVEIIPSEIRMRMDRVVLAPGTVYELELLASTVGGDVPVSPVAFSWTSEDADVASVSDEGVVTAVSAGQTKLTGVLGEKILEVTILVEQPEADVMPIESTLEGWVMKKTLMGTVDVSLLENGLAIDYVMGTNTRGSKITLTARKDFISRPSALRMKLSQASVAPQSVSFTFRAASAAKSTNITFSDFSEDGTADWVLPFSDYYDMDDPATYPIEFTSFIINPGDEAKAAGRLEFPNLEVIYPEGTSGLETITVEDVTGTDIHWYTTSGIEIPAPTSPGLYIRRTSSSACKVIIR